MSDETEILSLYPSKGVHVSDRSSSFADPGRGSNNARSERPDPQARGRPTTMCISECYASQLDEARSSTRKGGVVHCLFGDGRLEAR